MPSAMIEDVLRGRATLIVLTVSLGLLSDREETEEMNIAFVSLSSFFFSSFFLLLFFFFVF